MLHVYSRCVLIGLFIESASIVKSITAVAEHLTDFETLRELLEAPPTDSNGLLAPVSFSKLFYQLQSLLTFSSGAHERSDCLWFEHQQVRNVIERTYLKKGTSSSSSSSGGWSGRSAQANVARATGGEVPLQRLTAFSPVLLAAYYYRECSSSMLQWEAAAQPKRILIGVCRYLLAAQVHKPLHQLLTSPHFVYMMLSAGLVSELLGTYDKLLNALRCARAPSFGLSKPSPDAQLRPEPLQSYESAVRSNIVLFRSARSPSTLMALLLQAALNEPRESAAHGDAVALLNERDTTGNNGKCGRILMECLNRDDIYAPVSAGGESAVGSWTLFESDARNFGTALALRRAGDQLAVGFLDGSIRLFDPAAAKVLCFPQQVMVFLYFVLFNVRVYVTVQKCFVSVY